MKYPYFRGLEADRYSFYRVPKALIKVDLFEKMSGDAKLLYAVLLDRMNLSLKNGWQDENGNAYIICTIDEIMDSIRCARQKAVKLLDELEHEYQLVERRRQGLGKPNLLYVKDLYAGLSQSNYWKYENQTSGGLKSELPGVWKSNGSKTDSRKTKLGRVEWNPGTLAGVLANERHCGDVLARKTFTPNFLTHKSKKNNNDRTQYRQKNHHEAIVSREVFNAANHLRASRNYSKKNRPLPVLSVVEDGILRGYVPFDKDWTGFSAEEYREASESVMKEPDVTVTADVKKRLDLTGYEIVRVQYFSTMQNPAMTISNGRLRFNTACLKKFENVEYVELLLNSVERCIAIRPCDKNNPNAIRWGRLKEGRWCASTLGCRGLAKTLFDIMEWDEDLRYRFRGQFLEQGDNKMMLFAFDEPEMIKVEEIVLPPKENTEEDEGETVKKKIYIFPPEWAGTFGQPITSIAQVGILRQEHYAGNWDVFRPATEIEEMNIFTAESLNELLREAEKIMEGWTDYR